MNFKLKNKHFNEFQYTRHATRSTAFVILQDFLSRCCMVLR